MSLAIETRALTRVFGSLHAVDAVDLQIERGAIFGFLGPNGAGKTTMIRLLLGLLEPSSGDARVLGLDVRTAADRIREQTGALLEHPGIYERLSAEDNLEFYGRVWRVPAGTRKARIKILLANLGLWDRRRESPVRWSRGMRQKLAVARALLHNPVLVFLDEPTAGLDPVAAAALREDLAALAAREGVTVFLTTHNLVEAERLCSHIGVIRQGRLLAAGTPAQVRAQGGQPRLEITGRGFDDAVLAALRARPEVEAAAVRDRGLVIHLALVVLALLTLDIIVVAAAMTRFRRARLILD